MHVVVIYFEFIYFFFKLNFIELKINKRYKLNKMEQQEELRQRILDKDGHSQDGRNIDGLSDNVHFYHNYVDI